MVGVVIDLQAIKQNPRQFCGIAAKS